MRDLLYRPLSSGAKYLCNKIGLKVEIRRRRNFTWLGERDRFEYQRRYVDFNIRSGEQVLDIGNGGYPFPYGTVLVDRYPGETTTRYEPLVKNDKPFVMADIHDLPFSDKRFDFVYCSHVLELIENPLQACQEIIRVGRRGFIETPTFGKDALFAWAEGLQRWHVVAIGQHLCFYEYSARQLAGIKSTLWRDLILGQWHEPLQDIFSDNQDIFNVMFSWEKEFSVFVFRLNGSVQTLNAEVTRFPSGCDRQRT